MRKPKSCNLADIIAEVMGQPNETPKQWANRCQAYAKAHHLPRKARKSLARYGVATYKGITYLYT